MGAARNRRQDRTHQQKAHDSNHQALRIPELSGGRRHMGLLYDLCNAIEEREKYSERTDNASKSGGLVNVGSG